jgi:hypothetical protein
MSSNILLSNLPCSLFKKEGNLFAFWHLIRFLSPPLEKESEGGFEIFSGEYL